MGDAVKRLYTTNDLIDRVHVIVLLSFQIRLSGWAGCSGGQSAFTMYIIIRSSAAGTPAMLGARVFICKRKGRVLQCYDSDQYVVQSVALLRARRKFPNRISYTLFICTPRCAYSWHFRRFFRKNATWSSSSPNLGKLASTNSKDNNTFRPSTQFAHPIVGIRVTKY